MGKQILKIEDIAPDRDTVEIFGQSYELMTFDDLDLVDTAIVQRLSKQILSEINNIDERSPDELHEHEGRLNAFVQKVLKDISIETVGKITYRNKSAIINAFWQAVTERNATKTANQ